MSEPVFSLLPGAPTEKRAAPEQDVYDFLTRQGIPFERVDHPAAYTMEDCAAVDKALGAEMCKNLFLCNQQKTVFYLLLLKGEKPFKTKDVSKQLGVARLSFAGPEPLLEKLHILPGAVSAMGLIFDSARDVRLLIDEDLVHSSWLGCHPCVNTSSLRISMDDFLRRFLPAVRHEATFVRIAEPDAAP